MRRVAVVELKGQRHVHELALGKGRRVVIGRGWDSDVVVDDEFVDAAHLALEEGEPGELLVEDLGSRNGTRVGRRPLVGKAACTDGTRLSLGESVITLHEPGAGVAPATRFDAVNALARRFDSALWTIPATALAVAAVIGELHLLGAEEVRGDLVLETLGGLATMAILWCLVGGVVGRVLRHRAYLSLHWMVACAFVTGLFVAKAVSAPLAFNLDSDTFHAFFEPVLTAASVFALCYAFLSLSSRLGRVAKGALGLVAGTLPLLFSLVVPALQDDHERWTPVAISEPVRQPAGMLLVAPGTVDDHFADVEGVFAELEAAARESATPKDDAPVENAHDDPILSSEVE